MHQNHWKSRKASNNYTGCATTNRRKHFVRSFENRVGRTPSVDEIIAAEQRILAGKFRAVTREQPDGNQVGWVELGNASHLVAVHMPTFTLVSLLLPTFELRTHAGRQNYWFLTVCVSRVTSLTKRDPASNNIIGADRIRQRRA